MLLMPSLLQKKIYPSSTESICENIPVGLLFSYTLYNSLLNLLMNKVGINHNMFGPLIFKTGLEAM